MTDPDGATPIDGSSPAENERDDVLDLARARIDPAIERKQLGDFKFPLGVYPVEDLAPIPGYTLDFESADGGGEAGDLDEWPDRYVFDAVISAERVPSLVRNLIGMMPAKVFPILDILGHDAFREVDPFVAYDPVGLDRVVEALKQVPAFFYEDGLCGFGAMSEEPFFYFFVDEHKIVTIRVEGELKESVERLLAAFDLTQREDAAGVDAAAHEHRSVLTAPDDEPRLLNFDEVVEQLRDDWRLVLNIDPETNVDDDDQDLGTTGWWCRVRVTMPVQGEAPGIAETRYVEVVLSASCLREAEELSTLAAEQHAGLPAPTADAGETDDEDEPALPVVIFADRMTSEQLDDYRLKHPKRRPAGLPTQVHSVRWAD